jgi:hypothetical protein
MHEGDHILNSFLGYLFDRVQGENSLASHVEEIWALKLRFSKQDVIGREKHARKSWTNVSFLCLLDLVENKY